MKIFDIEYRFSKIRKQIASRTRIQELDIRDWFFRNSHPRHTSTWHSLQRSKMREND